MPSQTTLAVPWPRQILHCGVVEEEAPPPMVLVQLPLIAVGGRGPDAVIKLTEGTPGTLGSASQGKMISASLADLNPLGLKKMEANAFRE